MPIVQNILVEDAVLPTILPYLTPFGPSGQASGSSPTFSPLTIPGLMLWLRADLGVTLNSGNVSAWADQSGQGNNATQGTGADQPPLVSSGIGGQASLSFNGSSQFIKTGTLSAIPQTEFVVAMSNITSGGYATSDGTPAAHSLFVNNSASVKMGTAGGSLITALTNPLNPHMYCGLFNGSSSVVYVDAVPTSGTMSNETNANLYIGVGSSLWNGQIAEVIYYSGQLTSAQIQQVFVYLSGRYNIPLL